MRDKVQRMVEAYDREHPLIEAEGVVSHGPVETWSLAERLERVMGMTSPELRHMLQERLI